MNSDLIFITNEKTVKMNKADTFISDVERKIEEGVKQLKRLEWYQKWWDVLILGVVASTIVAIIFYFL